MITSIYEFANSLKPKNITIISIRSSQNSFGTGDQSLYIEKDIRKKLEYEYGAWYKCYNEENKEVNNQKYNFYSVTIAPRSLFRNDTDLSKEKKLKIKEEIISQFNCKEGEPDVYKQYRKEEIEKEKIRYEKDRQKKEYVLQKYDYKEHTPKDYVGGFDLDIIFEEKLISYIEQGLVFGYIGHRCRKIWVDRLLAKICLPMFKNKEDFACWLTSTDGRHFGDSIEQLVEDENKTEVEKIIKARAGYIHDKAVIYNHPEYKNMGKGAELWDKFNNMGMMYCEKNPFRITQEDIDNFGKRFGKE